MKLLACFVLLFVLCSCSRASHVREPKSIDQLTEQAHTIVIAQLANNLVSHKNTKLVHGNTAVLFQCDYVIKGDCGRSIIVDIPTSWAEYDKRTDWYFNKESKLILFLQAHGSGNWQLVQSLPPFVVLGKQSLRPASTEAEPSNQIADLLIDSFSDSEKFLTDDNFQLLTGMTHLTPVQLNRVHSYLSNPDLQIQSYALTVLAKNRVVDIIPEIAVLEAKLKKTTGSDTDAIMALDNYTQADAVPYLNSLIIDKVDTTRLNAISALEKIADKSSLPFLSTAMILPDPQDVVPFTAYRMIHRLRPDLGNPVSYAYFQAHEAQEIENLRKKMTIPNKAGAQ